MPDRMPGAMRDDEAMPNEALQRHDGDHILHWPQGPGTPLTLHLTPERAVAWPERHTLFVADMHLGKAAVFRARGVPVPHGTTAATLARLSAVIERFEARELVVLGDFLHAKESHASTTLASLRAWREGHAQLACKVVQGNHDRHAGEVEAALGFETLRRPYAQPGLLGVHEEHEAKPHLAAHEDQGAKPLVLAGHVHPVAVLQSRFDRLRLPCYELRDGVLTLPAFGEFTGGHAVGALPGQQVFVVGQRVSVLPPARSSTR